MQDLDGTPLLDRDEHPKVVAGVGRVEEDGAPLEQVAVLLEDDGDGRVEEGVARADELAERVPRSGEVYPRMALSNTRAALAWPSARELGASRSCRSSPRNSPVTGSKNRVRTSRSKLIQLPVAESSTRWKRLNGYAVKRLAERLV